MLEIEDIRHGIEDLANQYSIKRVRLFGSYAEGRQTESSDIDLLVEFNETAISIMTISSLKSDLEERLGVSVDVLHAPIPKDSMILPEKVISLYG